MTGDRTPFKKDREYYYLRNGILHVKHFVDDAVVLDKNETEALKQKIEKTPYAKQDVLKDEWIFQTVTRGKDVYDGEELSLAVTRELSAKYEENS